MQTPGMDGARMKIMQLLRTFAVMLAGVGTLGQQCQLLAAETNLEAAAAPAVRDVALDAQGKLHGQVVNSQGAPLAGADVVFHRGSEEVALTRTDKNGQFSVSGVQGGRYQLTAAHGGGAYRVWTADAAPPAASRNVLIVSDSQTVRGQSGTNRGGLVVLGIAGAIVTAGVLTQNNDSGS